MSKPRKSYTTRRISPVGRKSTFFDQKVESQYEGGGFVVRYSTRQKNKQDVLHVTVEMQGHGTIAEFDSFARLTPSTETAKVHANVGFRKHFGMSGEAEDYERAPNCNCIPA